ncbi:MAG: ATP-dependent DNA helicase PcrA, partial [Bifidobacteriales bacterium]|nr:ATP-dependent DNA helicase PcrA [Bifidobacteriales bacterium]
DLGDDEDEFGGFEDESDGRAFGHRSFGGFGSGLGSSRNGYGRSRTSSQRSFGSSSRNGRVTTRRSTTSPSSTSHAGRASAQPKSNGLSIQDFSLGDRVAHDQYGLGKVVDIQDKGHNSVLTVDFGSEGTKRLMLRLAPIEKL